MNRKKRLVRLTGSLLLLAVIAYFIASHVVQRVDIYGDSMAPKYKDGEIWMADKLTYYFREISRFDVVLFQYSRRSERYYVKRIIGLPGETVQIVNGVVWIDGKPLEDLYGTELIEEPQLAAKPILLGEDECFVLGDNRNNSSDSRDFDIGNIAKEQIIGRMAIRILKKE